MGDGFTADPDAMVGYAGQLGGYTGDLSTANDAANTVRNANSRKLGPVTDELRNLGLDDTGQFDGAYGLLCQPYGMMLQNMQLKAAEGIKSTMELMAALQRNLTESAKQYQETDQRASAAAKKLGHEVERLSAPKLHGPLPDLPTTPRIPGEPNGASHD